MVKKLLSSIVIFFLMFSMFSPIVYAQDDIMGPPAGAMIPQECIDAGATSPEECEKIMMSKFGPPPGMMPAGEMQKMPIMMEKFDEDCPGPHVGYKPEPYPGTPTSCRYMTDGCALEFETKEECLEVIKYEEHPVAEIEMGVKPGDALYFADKMKNDAELIFAGGERKAELAIKVKRERMLEAEELIRENLEEADEEIVEKHIEKVMEDIEKKERIIEREGSADLGVIVEEETKQSVETLVELKYKLPEEGWEGVKNALDNQITKEKKLQLAAQITRKIDALCEELAELDYDLMLAEPRCNPGDKPAWIKSRQKELKKKDEQALKDMLQTMQQCFDNPRECDCSGIPVKKSQAACEKAKGLAIRCEFKEDMSACDELDKYDATLISTIPALLRPFFKQKHTELKKAKQKEMMKKFAPPECIEAGATTREECEAIMMAKYAPPECIEAGATTKEECEEIMAPPECKERGVTERYACEAIMMEIYGAPPPECIDADGHFIGEQECNAIMMPPECIQAGATTEQECMMIMTPPECKAAGAFDRESCEAIMIEKHVPPECKAVGAYDEASCQKIMMEKKAPPECIEAGATTPEACLKIIKEVRIPRECEEAGAYDEASCHALLMRKHAPPECVDAGITSPEECKALIERIYGEKEEIERREEQMPRECIEAGTTTKEACYEIIKEVRIPRECEEAGATDEASCNTLLMQKYGAPECVDAGVTALGECKALMERIYGEKGEREVIERIEEREIMIQEVEEIEIPELPEEMGYDVELLPPEEIIEDYGMEEMSEKVTTMDSMVMGYGGGEMVSDKEVDQMIVESEAIAVSYEEELGEYVEMPPKQVEEMHEEIQVMEVKVEEVYVAPEPAPAPEPTPAPAPEPVVVAVEAPVESAPAPEGEG